MRTVLSLGFAVLWLASPVVAQEALTQQHQGSGYTIRFPDGWRVVDPKMTEFLNQSMNSAIPSTRGAGADVLITKGTALEDAPSLNIVIVGGEMPITDESREILKKIPTQIAPSLMGRADNIVVRDETFSGNPGLSVQYDLTVMGKKATQFLFSMPRGGKTYMICCTAPKEEFRSLEPTFRMMVASMELSFASTMPRWLLWGLIGGGIGLVVSLLGKLLKMGSGSSTYS